MVAVALAAVLLSSCGGGEDPEGSPTGTPGSSTVIPIPMRTPTPTPVPPPDATTYRFLYAEFGNETDTIWSIDPADPSDRVEVFAVPHKPGWAITATLSPDGDKIAYNVFPPQGLDSRTDAETYILDLESKQTTLVAQGVDLLIPPRWAPDAGLLFLRQNIGQDVAVILVDLTRVDEDPDEPPPVRLALRQHISDVLTYVPIGVHPETATLYFVQVQGGTQSGTYLARYAPASGEVVATATAAAEATATPFAATATAAAQTATPVPGPSPTPTPTPALVGSDFMFLTEQTASEFELSPDASRLAFLDPQLVEGDFVFQTRVADIAASLVTPLDADGLPAGEHLRPTWHPDGDKISVGLLPSGGDPGRVATAPLGNGEVEFLPPPDRGFDMPLSWSPDGKFLAVLSFPGESVANSGLPRLVFVAPTGQRLPAPEGSEVQVVGWLAVD